MDRENAQKQMRFEWRRSCEEDYDVQVQTKKIQNHEELKQLKTGPTTIGALGSHY